MNEAARDETRAGTEPAARGDTRSRIQAVAVELFSEQGYDKTSLREIAERLGVTKAALYYHFKSKDDILHSLIDDYFERVDELIAWGRTQPRTPAIRDDFLARYLDIVIAGRDAYRMMHQNQAVLASMKERGQLFRDRITSIIDLLAGPGASLPDRVRAAMAASGVSFCWMLFQDEAPDPDQLRAAVLGCVHEVAAGVGAPDTVTAGPVPLDLAHGGSTAAPPAGSHRASTTAVPATGQPASAAH